MSGHFNKSLMNSGGSSSNNQVFAGMTGKPMKTMNQIPSKQMQPPYMGINKQGLSQAVSMNNHLY